jgi:hypothetical protein
MSEVIRVTSIVATDDALSAYGGILLDRVALEQIAASLRSNRVEMIVSHDLTRPLNATVIDAQVRGRNDGHYEVWVEFDADREAWEEYEHEREAAGAPGGMSIGFGAPFGAFEGVAPDRPLVQIAADAFHFSEEDLAESGLPLAPYADVHVSQLFQLSAEPPVKVVLEYGLGLLASLPPELLGALVWDSVRGFVQKARSRGRRTIMDFHIDDRAGTRTVSAVVETDSDDVAKEAINRMADLWEESGRYQWDGVEWHRLD